MTETALRVIPLGGLGEIGKNMLALEYGDDIVVIDAGVLFPSEKMPGIDFVIPDITYLKENISRVRAILITHGHEDHIGALPYVLSELDVPVYASRLTHGLISVKLKEFGILKDARLNVVEPHISFKIGAFKVEFFRVCHSIPDAMGIALQTPLGTVVHTGDFKIDHTPADGKPTDFAALTRLTAGGVLLLLSDSTYAESEGYTESEQIVGKALERIIVDAEGRVVVATFASLISRMQQVIDAAVKCNRKISVIGRSMINNVRMATKMGYLEAPAGTIIPLSEARNLPLNEVVILATGAQGEPTSALVRIANGDHQDVEIVPGDTVLISASPIPGNETLVSRTIDNLYRQKARVLYSKIALVHVHGHASREELKMMLAMVNPRYFVPVHGEYRHLVAHADIARSMGVAGKDAIVLQDGDVLELTANGGTIVNRIPAGHVYVNGLRMWGDDGKVLTERSRLAREGVVTVVVPVDSTSGKIVGRLSLLSSGFVEMYESEDLLERTAEKTQIALEEQSDHHLELCELKSLVSNSVSNFLYNETRRHPKVLTHIQEV